MLMPYRCAGTCCTATGHRCHPGEILMPTSSLICLQGLGPCSTSQTHSDPLLRGAQLTPFNVLNGALIYASYLLHTHSYNLPPVGAKCPESWLPAHAAHIPLGSLPLIIRTIRSLLMPPDLGPVIGLKPCPCIINMQRA